MFINPFCENMPLPEDFKSFKPSRLILSFSSLFTESDVVRNLFGNCSLLSKSTINLACTGFSYNLFVIKTDLQYNYEFILFFKMSNNIIISNYQNLLRLSIYCNFFKRSIEAIK